MTLDLKTVTLTGFLEQLAERTPTPGGGAAAAASLAIAGAIAHMAIIYSKGRAALSDHDSLHDEALSSLSQVTNRALDLAEADAVAYGGLNDLFKRAEDDPVRVQGWDAAVHAAIEAPLQVMQESDALLQLLERLIEATSPMLRSDLAVAAITAEAAARSANCNVRINLPSVSDADRAGELGDLADGILERCRSAAGRVESTCSG